jgi:hypothetical protein
VPPRIEASGPEGETLVIPRGAKTRSPLARREAEVLREVMRYLSTRRDIFWWRANTGGATLKGRYVRFGILGCADIIGCYRGCFVAIECKGSTGKLSLEQESFRDEVWKHHGHWILASSVEDVVNGVKEIEWWSTMFKPRDD